MVKEEDRQNHWKKAPARCSTESPTLDECRRLQGHLSGKGIRTLKGSHVTAAFWESINSGSEPSAGRYIWESLAWHNGEASTLDRVTSLVSDVLNNPLRHQKLRLWEMLVSTLTIVIEAGLEYWV
ncbi:hypothetical protein RHMOL_Rhmol02G0151100 [Rhododendron molle]|uniref:Uncharacterized protein n=1 Tax=Rhododendron molle TaxID=49168 RepID=A0ACC0PTE4_RHOML|nr:hypothetical protein RHMOL_Rhmol02G0151100 [Rhododendron molle]